MKQPMTRKTAEAIAAALDAEMLRVECAYGRLPVREFVDVILSIADAAGEGASKTPDAVAALAKSLASAWLRYVELFGEPPHGTEQQLAALIELIPRDDGEDDGETVRTAAHVALHRKASRRVRTGRTSCMRL